MTDPPYNVAISNSDGKTIENDDMSDGAFRDFLYGCFVAVRDCLKAGAACYIWMASSEIDACIEAYEKAVLRQQDLDYCLASTWCMGAEDILQFREWVEADRIRKLDIYVGEIFSGSYAVEFQMLKRLYQDHPDLGRFALFRNHSKVYAGTGPLWSFGIQSSANINTNPRTENTCITIDRGLFEFYKKYYDGIKSFE